LLRDDPLSIQRDLHRRPVPAGNRALVAGRGVPSTRWEPGERPFGKDHAGCGAGLKAPPRRRHPPARAPALVVTASAI